DTVTATVTEAAGNSASAQSSVTVNNLAPAVTITGPTAGGVYTVGTPVALTASFTDAGTADTHTAQWTIGGVTTPGSVTAAGGSGTVADSYSFTAPGVYSVQLAVTDDDGGLGTDAVSITVVRRPTTTAASATMTTPLFGFDGETISAAVAAADAGSGTPTGTVTFYDGPAL